MAPMISTPASLGAREKPAGLRCLQWGIFAWWLIMRHYHFKQNTIIYGGSTATVTVYTYLLKNHFDLQSSKLQSPTISESHDLATLLGLLGLLFFPTWWSFSVAEAIWQNSMQRFYLVRRGYTSLYLKHSQAVWHNFWAIEEASRFSKTINERVIINFGNKMP